MSSEILKEKYEKPVIEQGEVVKIYACSGGTCNGKNHSISVNKQEDTEKNFFNNLNQVKKAV